jgi:hypothetical protein
LQGRLSDRVWACPHFWTVLNGGFDAAEIANLGYSAEQQER